MPCLERGVLTLDACALASERACERAGWSHPLPAMRFHAPPINHYRWRIPRPGGAGRTREAQLVEQVAHERLLLHQRHERGAVRAARLQRLHLLLQLAHLRRPPRPRWEARGAQRLGPARRRRAPAASRAPRPRRQAKQTWGVGVDSLVNPITTSAEEARGARAGARRAAPPQPCRLELSRASARRAACPVGTSSRAVPMLECLISAQPGARDVGRAGHRAAGRSAGALTADCCQAWRGAGRAR